jgi:hypothetical protein
MTPLWLGGSRQRLFVAVGLASQLLPRAALRSQSYRATLQLEWAADSSWQGTYFQKPYDFHIHEELRGRLTFVVDSALGPERASAAGAAAPRAVRAIQLGDDGAATGAVLVEAAGTSAYTADERKESGDCRPFDPRDTTGSTNVPYVARDEARGAWDAHAPGKALIVLRAAQPIGIAISPKPIRLQSVRRLLCPQPETGTRWSLYRITAQAGEAFRRSQADSLADSGRWTFTTSRTPRGGYTTTASYRAVTQRRVADDPSSALGQLAVTKTLVFTWEAVPETERAARSPEH